MELKPRFSIIILEEAQNFINSQDEKVRYKIQFNINISRYEINNELFKKLNSNIWEFRTRFNGISYRLFAFWDKNKQSMVIATHGIIKKTQKTPSKEIRKAEEIMKKYYEENR